MRALLEEVERLGFYIHRVTQTKGIWTLSDSDITAMVVLAKQYQVELVLAIGPVQPPIPVLLSRAPEGVRMGYRLRGQDQVVRAIEDVRRAARLGARTFLVYDEGCLWALDQARKAGAAYVVRAGFQDPLDPLEGNFGYMKTACETYKPEVLSLETDSSYNICGGYHKPYASCRHTHGAVYAALRAVHEAGAFCY